MAQLQNPTLTDMVNRLNTFREGSFGIDRRDRTAPWVLCVNRQMLPIKDLRLSLWDQDGLSICDLRELPDGHSLIFDEAGEAPATCRLVLAQKKDQTLRALTDDVSPITGYLFVTAHGSDTQPLTICALFDGTQGCQESCLLWHNDPAVVHFLHLQKMLLERGCFHDARQLQTDFLSDDEYNPFA